MTNNTRRQSTGSRQKSAKKQDDEKDKDKVATIIQQFVTGLSHQIPSSKLQTILTSTLTSADAGNNNGMLRLFLERSTEALPMGSRIRTAVGSNFDVAMELLLGAVRDLLGKEEDEGNDDCGHDDGVNNQNKKVEGSTEGGSTQKACYPILAFSEQEFNLKLAQSTEEHDDDVKVKGLLLCTDYASPSDHLQDALLLPSNNIVDFMQTLAQQQALNESTPRHDHANSSIDYSTIIKTFIKMLPSATNDDHDTVSSTIRHLISCLAIKGGIPAESAFDVGELIGHYAARLQSSSSSSSSSVEKLVVDTISTVLLSFAAAAEEEDGEKVLTRHTAARFVRGYIKSAPRATECALSALTVALQSNSTLKPYMPVLPKMKRAAALSTSSGKAKKEGSSSTVYWKVWKAWANTILKEETEDEVVHEVIKSTTETSGEHAVSKKIAVEQKSRAKKKTAKRTPKKSNASSKSKLLPPLPEEAELKDTDVLVTKGSSSKKRKNSVSSDTGNSAKADVPSSPKKRKESNASETSAAAAIDTPQRRSARAARKGSDASESVVADTPTSRRSSARSRTNSEASEVSVTTDAPRRRSARRKISDAK